MPVDNDIGYGRWTPKKLEVFSKIAAMHVEITRAVVDRHKWRRPDWTYRYIDLTAGAGLVPGSKMPGCALTMIEVLETGDEPRLNYRADLVEKDRKNYLRLQDSVQDYQDTLQAPNGFVRYHRMAYQSAIPGLLSVGAAREFGMVFVDPSGDAPDLGALAAIADAKDKLEILIYVSAGNLKRSQHVVGLTIDDYIKGVNKKHWLVRAPQKGDEKEWTFLLGSNTDLFKDYVSIDLYRRASAKGTEALEKLNLTRAARKGRAQMGIDFGDGDSA